VTRGGRQALRTRRRTHLITMGTCAVSFLLPWTVIVRFSGTAAAVVSVIALAIPPFAVIVANRRDREISGAGSGASRRRR
jgi:Protein of unknown function (DUF3099)